MATPTDLELAQMAASSDFIARVTSAISNYSNSILAGVYNQRKFEWASKVNPSAQAVANGLNYIIALDPAFKNQNPLNLPGTSDATFRAATEAAINRLILY